MELVFRTVFEILEDPRSTRNQKHPFLSLITIGLLSALAGIDSFTGMAEYVECHEEKLKELIALPHGVPHRDTLRRLFEALNANAFIECFTAFTQSLAESIKGLVSLDGKTIRNSRGKNGPLHVVSAWSEENRLVFGQVVADSTGGGELEAIKKLLELLELKECTVTLDALGCQKQVAEMVTSRGGNYVLAVKGNQKNLLDDIKEYFKNTDGLVSWEERDKGHGRIEQRTCWALDADRWLKNTHRWPELCSIAMVQSVRTIGEKKTVDVRFYVSSLHADPKLIGYAARRHWSIENKLHWMLDVTYNEDKACIRNENGAIIMNIMRKWALNILNNQKPKNSSIKSMHRKAAMSFKFLNQLLIDAFHA